MLCLKINCIYDKFYLSILCILAWWLPNCRALYKRNALYVPFDTTPLMLKMKTTIIKKFSSLIASHCSLILNRHFLTPSLEIAYMSNRDRNYHSIILVDLYINNLRICIIKICTNSLYVYISFHLRYRNLISIYY